MSDEPRLPDWKMLAAASHLFKAHLRDYSVFDCTPHELDLDIIEAFRNAENTLGGQREAIDTFVTKILDYFIEKGEEE